MTSSPLEYSARSISLEEQSLYDHFHKCVQTESPEKLLDRFCCLFIKGREYQNPDIRLALVKIINSQRAEKEFKLILNRCFFILVGHWQQQPRQQTISQMLQLWEKVLPPRRDYYRTSYRLRKLMQDFACSDQYLKLQRLGRVMSKEGDLNGSVGQLIYRYPYLYKHCLLSKNYDDEHLKIIGQMQKRVQHQFELHLSRYVTDKVRRKQEEPTHLSEEKRLRPPENPTLLTQKNLDAALKQFFGSIQGSYTHRDLAQSFLIHSSQSSFKAFKDDFYEYLTAGVDCKYGRYCFNDRLYATLHSILPNADSQKLNEFLLLRTTSQILSFLTVDMYKYPNHHTFVDLVSNLGAKKTVSLLLKVVLLSSKLKPHLEKRLAILFGLYEEHSVQEVPWLVKVLEYLLIALSGHFGKADVSCLAILFEG